MGRRRSASAQNTSRTLCGSGSRRTASIRRALGTTGFVLAKAESRWPAWWEAIVVENADDLFELRWRDNASAPPITRPRLDLALLCPDAAS